LRKEHFKRLSRICTNKGYIVTNKRWLRIIMAILWVAISTSKKVCSAWEKVAVTVLIISR